ncbi:hypothetical protein [Chengkuizengella marina]|uniref:Uncharacterized protein n=1 Tax=Chengkuizengella marina TaxID=2507566 RepID=A0A6N9Q5Y1_9BACL|nr:hypothetical protein [Chengkuizengella marina]NBI30256.1 hypothetical protein [Chengkuizengella marina]
MLKNSIEGQDKIVDVVNMLYPKIKSVLQKTHITERDDLEQILIETIVTKIDSGYFESGESLIDLLEKEYKIGFFERVD